MTISIDDLGFRQAVTAVERLRTYHRQPFLLAPHVARWQRTVDELGIDCPRSVDEIATSVDELLRRNDQWLQHQGDASITLFATPGPHRPAEPAATFGLHLSALDHELVASRRRHGQPLVITHVAQPPLSAWPREIKVRSRLHFYRADRLAKQSDPAAIGALLDDDGSVTETSVANLAVVSGGAIVSPPADRVLTGITQAAIEGLAAEAGILWDKQSVPVASLRYADEILLMGTDTGIWFASHIDGHPVGQHGDQAEGGPVYRELRRRFDELIRCHGQTAS